MNLVFDIETNGLHECNKIFCVVAYDVDTKHRYSYGPDNIDEAMELLLSADKLIGHNIIGFDIPVVERLMGIDLSDIPVVDTLVVSRLTNPTREGGHGLESWGYRLGYPKIEFEQFDKFSAEMLIYCERDVDLNAKVYEALKLEAQGFNKESVELEQETYKIISKQVLKGFKLDTRHATTLQAQLQDELDNTVDEIGEVFKPREQVLKLYPTRLKSGGLAKTGETLYGETKRLTNEEFDNMTLHNQVTRVIVTEFNVGSRKQIGEYLQDFGWKPTKLTPTGQPIVDESTLMKIKGIPQAALIARYLMLQKRIAQLKSWLTAQDEDGRVRGYVNSNGTITGRMTHRNPNLGQVPSLKKPYGKEMRQCWIVDEGYSLVGIDASGLEARMLAHHLNDKEYIHEILNGDIHELNRGAAKLESRDTAKTFLYALIYGAGDKKIGSIVGGNASAGASLRDSFFDSRPTFRTLLTSVKRQATKGFLKGLDGRRTAIRSAHSALNTLLQGDGSIVIKKALVILQQKIYDAGLDAHLVATVHDEYQFEVKQGQEDAVGKLGIQAIVEAGEHFNLNCALDGEYKYGLNWAETH